MSVRPQAIRCCVFAEEDHQNDKQNAHSFRVSNSHAPGAALLAGLILFLLAVGVALAGGLNPGAGPAQAGSQMVTLQQIWDRINNGTAATKMGAFTEPAVGPGSTIKTLYELYTLAGERPGQPRRGRPPATPRATTARSRRAWPGPTHASQTTATAR